LVRYGMQITEITRTAGSRDNMPPALGRYGISGGLSRPVNLN
jgi:hypothetical protein